MRIFAHSFLLLLLAGVLALGLSSARADDADAVKDKLFEAKKAYDAEVQKFKKAVGDLLDKREDTARKAGNKKVVDQVKAERDAFEKNCEIPSMIPVNVREQVNAAKMKLDKAYSAAIKEYTRLKMDEAAAAIEKEQKEFLLSSPQSGWIQLFNGKDLTGWKMYNPPSGQFKGLKEAKNADGKVVAFVGVLKDGKEETLWQVIDGMIVGGGPSSHLFSEVEADNVRYRVEAKINDHGNSGQYFRTKFGPGFPQGYEVQINATHGDPVKTGSLYPAGTLGKYRDRITVLNTAPHKPDEFFTQEVIADGPKIKIIVNGKTTVDWVDPDNTYKKGHFALQGHHPGSVMTFKKVEYMPLTK